MTARVQSFPTSYFGHCSVRISVGLKVTRREKPQLLNYRRNREVCHANSPSSLLRRRRRGRRRRCHRHDPDRSTARARCRTTARFTRRRAGRAHRPSAAAERRVGRAPWCWQRDCRWRQPRGGPDRGGALCTSARPLRACGRAAEPADRPAEPGRGKYRQLQHRHRQHRQFQHRYQTTTAISISAPTTRAASTSASTMSTAATPSQAPATSTMKPSPTSESATTATSTSGSTTRDHATSATTTSARSTSAPVTAASPTSARTTPAASTPASAIPAMATSASSIPATTTSAPSTRATRSGWAASASPTRSATQRQPRRPGLPPRKAATTRGVTPPAMGVA